MWTGAENHDPRTIQPEASRYTDWAIAPHKPRVSLISIHVLYISALYFSLNMANNMSKYVGDEMLLIQNLSIEILRTFVGIVL